MDVNRSLHRAVDTLTQQSWLDPVADGLQGLVSRAYEAAGPAKQTLVDLLSGTWLGHALHPVLTDVPLGAWTATLVLDLMESLGDSDLAAGADATLAIGLAGAVVAAAAGLNDWQYTTDRNRRLGTMHALINSSAALCYGISFVQRRLDQRGAGRAMAILGAGIVTAGAYLGGELVSGGRVGVDHAPRTPLPQDFQSVLPLAALTEDQPRLVHVNGVDLVLVRHDGQICALAATCSHLGGPLAEGQIEDGSIICPWHGSRFSLRDGAVLGGPATFAQPHYEARSVDGNIEVRQPPDAT